MANELSPQMLQQLRQHIDAAMAQPAPAAAALPPGAPLDFCTVWPTAKPILQALAGIVLVIPGFGAAAAAALNALITVGDQVFKATCKP